MEIHVHIHHVHDPILDRIEQVVNTIKTQGEMTMAKVDELKQAIADIATGVTDIQNNTTEIGGDVQEVLDKLANANPTDGLTAAETAEVLALMTGVNDNITKLKDQTRAVADMVPEKQVP